MVVGVVLLALASAGPAGCAGTPPAPVPSADQPLERPSDLALGVTVFSSSIPGAAAGSVERWRRPARYIVEPDGMLRAALGPGARTDTYPPATRRLDPAQMDLLWRLLVETGLTDPEHPDLIDSATAYTPSGTGPEALIAMSASGGYQAVSIELATTTREAASARRLVDQLAEMAWIRK